MQGSYAKGRIKANIVLIFNSKESYDQVSQLLIDGWMNEPRIIIMIIFIKMSIKVKQ